MNKAYSVPRLPTAFSLGAGGKTKRPRQKNDGHLRWLRTLPCVITGTRPVEAAHVRFPDLRRGKPSTGAGEKPDDRWALPLAPDKHRAQHADGNEPLWWARFGIDPIELCLALWGVSGDDEAAEEIIRRSVETARTFLGRQASEQ